MAYTFFAMLSRMKDIRRWALMRNTRPENISEHSHEVAVLAHALALLTNAHYGGQVDPDRCVTMAVYHDVPEILTGDMPTPVKYYSPAIREAYRQVEQAACDKLLSTLPEELRSFSLNADRLIGRYFGGFFCVLGHLFPVFYQFRGGKGVLATLGMLFVVDWRVALLGLAAFGITVAISRMVSLGSIVAACVLPICTLVLGLWVDHTSSGAVVFCTVLIGLISGIVIWKHKGNIDRIAAGTERRIGEDKV